MMRDNIEVKSHVKQALIKNGYPDWIISSILIMQPSLESITSVSSDGNSDDV